MATTQCAYLKREWVGRMCETLATLHPEMDGDEIREFVEQQFNENYRDTECQIYNSYENTVIETSLGGVVDWIDRKHPIISESGVFFYPKNEKRNVNTEIIKEDMLDRRTLHKAEKFEAMKRGDVFTAAVKDLEQGNDKKAANSGYGAEGQSSSFLYNPAAAMSVTAAGRGQLSTMILCFENLFGDNVKFWSMDEFFNHIGHIVNEKHEWKYDTDDIIDRVPGRKQWVHRFEGKFIHHTKCDTSLLERTYDSLSDELRIRTYYKCNLRDFFRLNRYTTELFQRILDTDDLHDKKGEPTDFVDPNAIPVEIADDMKELRNIVAEFVGYKYSQFRYEDRARYMRRKVIIVADTDS